MASFKSYLNNNAPFLNARNKWQTTAGERAKAQAKWEAAKETDANYQQLLAVFKDAQEKERIAKAAKDQAEKNAQLAFDKIESDKKAKASKKEIATTQNKIDLAQAEVNKYINAGLAVPVEKQNKLDTLKNKLNNVPKGSDTTTITTNAGTGDTSNVDLITQTNTALAEKAKQENATNYVYGLTKEERLDLAKKLNAANYKAPITGAYNSALVDAYISALTDAQNENTYNKNIKGYIPNTLESYLTYKTGLVGGTGGDKTTIRGQVSDDTTADAYVKQAFKINLNREATPEELVKYRKILQDGQRKNVYKTVNGITTGGINEGEFLARELQKLPEFSTKKKEKDTLITQDLQSIARANGINLSADQLATYANDVNNGKDINVIKNNIRNIAGYGMPDNIKKMLADGTDLETIYAPYKQTMASVLELNPADITLDDSVLRSAIGPDKELPLYEFKKMLKKDSRWQYTNNARAEVSDKVLRVLRDFGFQG